MPLSSLKSLSVLKPGNKTTLLRVVFDASAGEVSLNQCLETGPCLLNSLLNILLHFRVHQFAFCADIQHAFLCIQVAEKDRNYLWFLWFWNNDPDGEIISLRYQCLNFGPTCLPYILNFVLQHHLASQNLDVAMDMKAKIYVDNLASGCNSVKHAEKYFVESHNILQSA